MKHLKLYEGFTGDVGVLLILLTHWIATNRLTISNILNNLQAMKSDFIAYVNTQGYSIDDSMIDYQFTTLIEKIKNVLQ